MSETQERDERVTFKMRFILLLGNRERTTVPYLYTGILIFFLAYGGKELTKEQGHLGSLCASPYRLHCRQSPVEANLKDRRRKTKQAPFLDTSPALKTQKPRLHRLEQRNRC